jgi:hypothetical protein
MRSTNITFWVSTTIIFLFEGVMPALTSHTAMAHEGLTHLGYPLYFGTMLMVFKVCGVLALMVPQVPARVKEWAYAGFAFDFIAAFWSHAAIDGIGTMLIGPIIGLVVLALSYTSHQKRRQAAGIQI